MKPTRVQLKRTKGWRMPPNTVKVDRSTRWGNPFRVGRHLTPQQAVMSFHYWLLDPQAGERVEPKRRKWILDNIHTLRGKRLACWCHYTQHCHADVLSQLANASDGGRTWLPCCKEVEE